MMLIDIPVASYSPPAEIREWIAQLESAKKDLEAEPFDLMRIEKYLARARGWLAAGAGDASDHRGSAA